MVSIPKISKLSRPTKVYTLQEYLSREARESEKHEFYNGKIVKMPGGTHTHSEIAANMVTALKIGIRQIVSKFRVYSSDLKIYIEKANTSVYPDVLVICEEPQFWQTRKDIIVNPLLVVEVLSPSTRTFDRMGKFELYKMLPSFQEYVLINADEPFVETRFQEATDLWRMRKETDMQKNITLHSIGVTISMSDIYENIIF
jgi:Uma2 family endonuclease